MRDKSPTALGGLVKFLVRVKRFPLLEYVSWREARGGVRLKDVCSRDLLWISTGSANFKC
jgi:hypothetical protein